jgi:hypothetical protein
MKQIQEIPPTIFVGLLLVLLLLLAIQTFAHRRTKNYAVFQRERFDRDIKQFELEAEQKLKGLRSEHSQEKITIAAEHVASLSRCSEIIDMEAELKRLEKSRLDQIESAADQIKKLDAQRRAVEENISELRASYSEKRATYDRLRSELAIFDERLALAELGVYEPHFDFGDSEAFKTKIRETREDQKDMVKRKTAVFGTKDWTVDGSVSKGETMINRAVRITLRAFNNECEAAIANTRWNNVKSMEKRIVRAQSTIDKLNLSNNVVISEDYLHSKIRELWLTHEYRERLKSERDERSEAARLERDEKRLLQEAKAAQQEEERYQKLLDTARAELGVVTTEEHHAKVRELEILLAKAHEKTERAQAMAEKTKSGFVYVISNVGSFGENVVKIGLTRRLDPSDRVKELGDASVPFLFDTHAMIYSDEAPALETALHLEFAEQRINAANMRKEFFKVTLAQVEDAVKRLAPEAEFHTDIEAQEFYETLAKRKELAKRLSDDQDNKLPIEI